LVKVEGGEKRGKGEKVERGGEKKGGESMKLFSIILFHGEKGEGKDKRKGVWGARKREEKNKNTEWKMNLPFT